MKKMIRFIAALAAIVSIFGSVRVLADDMRTLPVYEPSSYYSQGMYYNNLVTLTLTGDQRRDYVNVALTQYGYHEGDTFADLTGYNLYGSLNYTEYGYWYGMHVSPKLQPFFTPWCAFFASWCARQALIPTSIINDSAYARIGTNVCHFHMEYRDASVYLPKTGDLIFYDSTGTGQNWTHVGIVMYVEDSCVVTIEGNMNGRVRMFRHELDYWKIRGYGTPAYETQNIYAFDIGAYPVPTKTLKVGMSGDDVAWSQTALLHLGYITPVDGVFTEELKKVVRSFQTDNGISSTGNVGPLTLAALKQRLDEAGLTPVSPSVYPTPVRTLKPGMSGDDVKWAQAALKRLGFDMSVTGYYGNKTYEYVKLFQNTWGISPTGSVGPLTKQKFIELLGLTDGTEPEPVTPAPEPTPDPENPYPEPERKLYYGMSGDDVKWVQTSLKRLGFNAHPTGYYGWATKQRVMFIQRLSGIEPSGIFGPWTKLETKRMIEALDGSRPSIVDNPYPMPEGLLKKGDSGNEVRWLQYSLKCLGCDRLQGTGYFGDLTESYVKWFQSNAGLPQTGRFDEWTRSYMLTLVYGL